MAQVFTNNAAMWGRRDISNGAMALFGHQKSCKIRWHKKARFAVTWWSKGSRSYPRSLEKLHVKFLWNLQSRYDDQCCIKKMRYNVIHSDIVWFRFKLILCWMTRQWLINTDDTNHDWLTLMTMIILYLHRINLTMTIDVFAFHCCLSFKLVSQPKTFLCALAWSLCLVATFYTGITRPGRRRQEKFVRKKSVAEACRVCRCM